MTKSKMTEKEFFIAMALLKLKRPVDIKNLRMARSVLVKNETYAEAADGVSPQYLHKLVKKIQEVWEVHELVKVIDTKHNKSGPEIRLAEILALDGRIEQTLNADELGVLKFYMMQGRKFGVNIAVTTDIDPAELAQAKSEKEASYMLEKANRIINVMPGMEPNHG